MNTIIAKYIKISPSNEKDGEYQLAHIQVENDEREIIHDRYTDLLVIKGEVHCEFHEDGSVGLFSPNLMTITEYGMGVIDATKENK